MIKYRMAALFTALGLLCMTGCTGNEQNPEQSLSSAETQDTLPTAAMAETDAVPSETDPPQTEAATEEVTETIPETTEEETIPVESITLSFYEISLYVGDSAMPRVTMDPENATDKGEIWSTSDNRIASVDYLGNITANEPGSCVISVAAAENPEITAQVQVTVEERPQTDPPPTEAPAPEPELTYINGILIANKTYALPSSYNPGLDPTCEAQFALLREGAAADGLNIYLSSGFRSYDYQARIYNNYVAWYGQEKTDTLSARPGHSEHQTGLAIDVNIVNDSFIGTPEAIWLAEHAHEYGFIIRYPKGKEHITGYKYEPWHIRYLGVETATAVYESGLCLEEYLGITSCYAD